MEMPQNHVAVSPAAGSSAKVPEVLQLVLQHCPDLSTPQDICTLLQVSSVCRQAVQQARVKCSIDSSQQQSLQTAAGLSSFAVWLPAHRGLVSNLDVENVSQAEPASSISIMQNMLMLAIRACAAPPPAAAGGPSAPNPIAGPGTGVGRRACPVVPPQLQLDSFRAGLLTSPAVLAALAGIQLRKLHLSLQLAQLSSTLCEALELLSSLELVCITSRSSVGSSLSAVESARLQQVAVSLARLPTLSGLRFGPLPVTCMQHLPASLTGLTAIAVPEVSGAAAPAAANLQHLTTLQELLLYAAVRPFDVLLPPSVSALTVHGPARVSQPHALLHVLRHVRNSADLAIVQDLSTQQQPWALEFQIRRQDLAIEEQHVAALQDCTSLTSLMVRADSAVGTSAPWCRHVCTLKQLVELELQLRSQQEVDLLQLSSLTCLTSLRFSCRQGLTDAVVVSLACSLVNLREFHSVLPTVAAIPAIGRLTGLRSLSLVADARSTVRAQLTSYMLSQLLSLTQLTFLGLPLSDDVCPDEAQQQFVSRMPGLRSIAPC